MHHPAVYAEIKVAKVRKVAPPHGASPRLAEVDDQSWKTPTSPEWILALGKIAGAISDQLETA